MFLAIVGWIEPPKNETKETQTSEDLKTKETETHVHGDLRNITLQPELQQFYSECYKYTDFKLVSTSGVKIPCHRIILALRCKFFYEMFKNVSEESTNEPLLINDANSTDLQAFVDYI